MWNYCCSKLSIFLESDLRVLSSFQKEINSTVDSHDWDGFMMNSTPFIAKCLCLLSTGKSSFPVLSLILSFPSHHYLSSVQSLRCVWLFATPWTAAHQASLSISNSQSLLKLMSIELMMSSNHLILCCPLLLLPSIFPSIRALSNYLHLNDYLHLRHWTQYYKKYPSFNPENFSLHNGFSLYSLEF